MILKLVQTKVLPIAIIVAALTVAALTQYVTVNAQPGSDYEAWCLSQGGLHVYSPIDAEMGGGYWDCYLPLQCSTLGLVGTYPDCRNLNCQELGYDTGTPPSSCRNFTCQDYGYQAGTIGNCYNDACPSDAGIQQYASQCTPAAPVCASNSGQSCTSAANSCGMTNSGSIDCSGSCSASAPSDSSCPSSCVSYQGQTCGVSSSCGSASGTYQCDGSCSATAPSVPSNYGQSCVSSANSCGMTNTGTRTCGGTCTVSTPPDSACSLPPETCSSPAISSFIVSPTRVRAGTPTDLTFTIAASGITTSCVITGPGVNQTVAASTCNASGSVTATGVSISSQATYTATCDTASVTAKAYVNVIPRFEPF